MNTKKTFLNIIRTEPKYYRKYLLLNYQFEMKKKFSNQSYNKFKSPIANTLARVEQLVINNNGKANESIQKDMEILTLEEFDISKQYVADISSNAMNANISKYIINKYNLLDKYINNLILSLNTKKAEEDFMKHIFDNIDLHYIRDISIHTFLKVLTYQNTDNRGLEEVYVLPCSIRIGKKIISKFNRSMLTNYRNNIDNNIGYSEWIEIWKKNNEKYNNMIDTDDNFYSKLGAKILDILDNCDMVEKKLVKDSNKEHHYELSIKDPYLIKFINKNDILSIPSKLPMISKPKPFSKNKIGGFLLNDVEYRENLFIEKKGYKFPSCLTESNKVYDMVNKVSNVPFKINTDLLSFITKDKKHDLLLDPLKEHEFAHLEKRTKSQDKKYKSYNSKIVLQQIIIELAEFYKIFNEIYFPVRLDQRGRLYCTPSYFNYQSSELAKSLILFSRPGIINRNNLNAINYLKALGAAHFGGSISKKSLLKKTEWVDKNIHNIINYDNGILLKKANEKLLFLSFCIEFKRFYEFYIDENQHHFETYLPIQLDATCNGFQHMALLSNEETLFKELNLKKSSLSPERDDPRDFYSFLLYKIMTIFESHVNKSDLEDPKTGGSYKRLHDFVWDRKNIKKTIMTIPYNVTKHTMHKYVLESLHEVSRDGKITWYSDMKNKKTLINNKDAILLVDCIQRVVFNDFVKIKNLSRYLKNIAQIHSLIGLPICWQLPSGLIINQSYLETKTTSISPFIHSKIKLNFKVSIDKYDADKQQRALMPNLIHSLDATSLTLLFNLFVKQYPDNGTAQFYSVHDCFGTTADKVSVLKTLLASIYTNIYSNDKYLCRFDDNIFNYISDNTNFPVDKDNRTITLGDGQVYKIHNIDWVLNRKVISKPELSKIDNQYILI